MVKYEPETLLHVCGWLIGRLQRTSFAGMKQTDLEETADGRVSFDFVCNEVRCQRALHAIAPLCHPKPKVQLALAKGISLGGIL